jgi:hypothetical protein
MAIVVYIGATLTTVAYSSAALAQTVEVTDWDVGTGKPTAQPTAPLKTPRALAFAPRGRMLAAAEEENREDLTLASYQQQYAGTS